MEKEILDKINNSTIKYDTIYEKKFIFGDVLNFIVNYNTIIKNPITQKEFTYLLKNIVIEYDTFKNILQNHNKLQLTKNQYNLLLNNMCKQSKTTLFKYQQNSIYLNICLDVINNHHLFSIEKTITLFNIEPELLKASLMYKTLENNIYEKIILKNSIQTQKKPLKKIKI